MSSLGRVCGVISLWKFPFSPPVGIVGHNSHVGRLSFQILCPAPGLSWWQDALEDCAGGDGSDMCNIPLKVLSHGDSCFFSPFVCSDGI